MDSGLPFINALSNALSLLPPSDVAGISISELSISDMCAWCTAKADEHHRLTLTYNAMLNILTPVHRLPSEILSRIFVEAWHERKSLRLTHVCRLWRTILLDTSQFWAVAIAGDEFRLPSDGRGVSDEDYLAAVCARSAPRNISLQLSFMSPRGHLQLMQHADRITSMRISARTDDHLELLWNVLHSGMPRLENLAIRAPDWIGVDRDLLPAEGLPFLTRLSLTTCLFLYSWPNTLQELALRPYDEHSQIKISLKVFLKALKNYPRLRVLDVRDNTLIHDMRFRPPSCALPRLELLRVRSFRAVVSTMLSLLTFPPSTHLDISIRPDPGPDPEGPLFVPGCALDAVAARVDHITVHGGLTLTVCGSTDGVERLRVSSFFRDFLGPGIGLFARTGAPASRLLLTLNPPHALPMYIGEAVFSGFTHFTHLTLRGRTRVCADVLAALHPERGAFPWSESAPPFLPRLQDLTMGLATTRGSHISNSLRGSGGTSSPRRSSSDAVVIHFRECCRLFRGLLDARAARGYRLSRLEFFSYEEGRTRGRSGPRAVSHVDLAALDRDLVERELEPIRSLVDGRVVFSGYRFFTEG